MESYFWGCWILRMQATSCWSCNDTKFILVPLTQVMINVIKRAPTVKTPYVTSVGGTG